jgi:signal peptidase I
MQVTALRDSNDTRPEPALYAEKGYELSLPSRTLTELLINVLHRGAAFRFRAKGFSMSPFIKDSDVITVVSVSTYKPRFGDVVVFINPDTEKLIIHRVIGKRDNFHFFIKGDNPPTHTHLVPISQILGSVKRVERDGRRVALGLGPEKALIALLSRRHLLLPLLLPLWRIIRPILRRSSR